MIRMNCWTGEQMSGAARTLFFFFFFKQHKNPSERYLMTTTMAYVCFYFPPNISIKYSRASHSSFCTHTTIKSRRHRAGGTERRTQRSRMSHVEGEKPQPTPRDETATCPPASNKTKPFLKIARRDLWHLDVHFRYQLNQFERHLLFSLPVMAASNLWAEKHLQSVIKNIMSHC